MPLLASWTLVKTFLDTLSSHFWQLTIARTGLMWKVRHVPRSSPSMGKQQFRSPTSRLFDLLCIESCYSHSSFPGLKVKVTSEHSGSVLVEQSNLPQCNVTAPVVKAESERKYRDPSQETWKRRVRLLRPRHKHNLTVGQESDQLIRRRKFGRTKILPLRHALVSGGHGGPEYE